MSTKIFEHHNSEPWDMAHDNVLCCVSLDMAMVFFKKSIVPHCENFPSTSQIKKIEE